MITYESVGHRYDDRTVLDDVTLALPEHRVGLVGANGSGKSTLARMVNGLVRPTSGRVLVDGLDPTEQGAAVRRRVGFVFTNPDSQIVMPTAGEDVAFSLRRTVRNRADRAARAAEVLAAHGLEGYADDRIADGPGWIDFDVARIRCPVVVLHGTEDKMVDVIHPRHTAAIVPGAELDLHEGHGHFSIEAFVIPTVSSVLSRA